MNKLFETNKQRTFVLSVSRLQWSHTFTCCAALHFCKQLAGYWLCVLRKDQSAPQPRSKYDSELKAQQRYLHCWNRFAVQSLPADRVCTLGLSFGKVGQATSASRDMSRNVASRCFEKTSRERKIPVKQTMNAR